MQARNVSRDEIAELKMYIIHQQEWAAELEQAGKSSKARAACNKLYPLLHRLDVLRAASLEA
jgi:hypothetical protein